MSRQLGSGGKLGETQDCPCGSGRPRRDCCLPYHLGPGHAPTAEALMRSRYVAYHYRNSSYLLKTWHPSTRPQALKFDEDDDTQWVGLKVLDVHSGGADDPDGEVTFEARYLSQGRVSVLAERSRFTRVDGAWRYLDGDLSQTVQPVRVGRNDPCPCGSNRKFKRCCG